MKHRGLLFLLAALSMPGALCIDAYLPSMSAIGLTFHASAAALQQTLSVYLFTFALMTLFYGTLSDSFGRRPVILASLFLYVGSSIGATCSYSLGALLLFRVLQGISAGAGSVIGQAIVRDCLTGAEAQRALATMSVIFGIAPAVAPILGGWLQQLFGWRAVFLFITLFGAALLFACFRWLGETLPAAERHPFHFQAIVRNYWKVARHPSFLLRSLSVSILFSGVALYVGGAPAFVLEILHLKVTDFGWIFIPLIGGMTLGSYLASRLGHTLPPRRLIGISFVVMGVGAAANLAVSRFLPAVLPWAVVPIGVYAFGATLGMSSMTIETLELFPHVRGLPSSLQSFLFMMLFALVSGVLCPLLFASSFHFALAMGALYLTGVLLWKFCSRLHEQIVEETIEA